MYICTLMRRGEARQSEERERPIDHLALPRTRHAAHSISISISIRKEDQSCSRMFRDTFE
jgi:hypothetical protein